MNTPAHLAASVLVWRNEPGWKNAAAVTFGAVLPDLPMFGFYAYQKYIGSTEREIWTTRYFQPDWQLLFDVFNSIPLCVAAMAICWIAKNRFGFLMAASALLHVLCDLPLHHDDAHRHFLPLSTWRFHSPISYWDPAHHGRIFMILELVFAVAACSFVGLRGVWPMRAIGFANLGLYAFSIALALAWLFGKAT